MFSPPVVYFHHLLSPSLFLSQSFYSWCILGNIFVGTRVSVIYFVFPINILCLPHSQLALRSLNPRGNIRGEQEDEPPLILFQKARFINAVLGYAQQVSQRAGGRGAAGDPVRNAELQPRAQRCPRGSRASAVTCGEPGCPFPSHKRHPPGAASRGSSRCPRQRWGRGSSPAAGGLRFSAAPDRPSALLPITWYFLWTLTPLQSGC